MNDGYRIERFANGPMDNLAYLVIDKASGAAAVIDPAWDADAYQSRADAAGARITEVWLTHSHYDHVNALGAFADLPVHLSRAEHDFWGKQRGQGGAHDDTELPTSPVLHDDGDTVNLGETSVNWHVTPGHSPGSSVLLLAGDALVADTLFVYGCGRCDLPGSDPEAMFDSLARLKSLLSPAVNTHPGHDYGVAQSITMAEQLTGNPFLMFDDPARFVQYRMHDHGTLRSQPYGPERAPYA